MTFAVDRALKNRLSIYPSLPLICKLDGCALELSLSHRVFMKTALFSISRGACCVQNDNPLKENALFASDFIFKTHWKRSTTLSQAISRQTITGKIKYLNSAQAWLFCLEIKNYSHKYIRRFFKSTHSSVNTIKSTQVFQSLILPPPTPTPLAVVQTENQIPFYRTFTAILLSFRPGDYWTR